MTTKLTTELYSTAYSDNQRIKVSNYYVSIESMCELIYLYEAMGGQQEAKSPSLQVSANASTRKVYFDQYLISWQHLQIA